MNKHFYRFFLLIILAGFTGGLFSCATDYAAVGNESGSQPISAAEQKAYEKAIRRCQKTGGTRIVKISGILRCF